MEENSIISIYNSNKKAHLKKLDVFTHKLDEIESLIDTIVFDLKQNGVDTIELVDGDEIEPNPLKNDKDVNEVLYDTKKVMKVIQKMSGKKRIYNSSPINN